LVRFQTDDRRFVYSEGPNSALSFNWPPVEWVTELLSGDKVAGA